MHWAVCPICSIMLSMNNKHVSTSQPFNVQPNWSLMKSVSTTRQDTFDLMFMNLIDVLPIWGWLRWEKNCICMFYLKGLLDGIQNVSATCIYTWRDTISASILSTRVFSAMLRATFYFIFTPTVSRFGARWHNLLLIALTVRKKGHNELQSEIIFMWIKWNTINKIEYCYIISIPVAHTHRPLINQYEVYKKM